MRNNLLILLIFLNVQAIAQNTYQYEPDAIKNIALMEQKSYSINKYKPTKNVVNNYDIKYSRFQWQVDPNILFIKGEVTTYFVITQANAAAISFDLSHNLVVDSVRYHNSFITFLHSANDELLINFPSTLPLNQFDSLAIYYHGVPITTGFGAFIKDIHNGVPIISTLSEPYGAKEWFPCKNDLTDKIDSIDIFVTTPVQYRTASNGMLISETIQGINKIAHWKHRYPIATYLIAIAVTNYAVYSDYFHYANDSIQILNYVYPEDSATLRTVTPATSYGMGIYDSLFGTYPFINERYGHAQFSVGGGMEHQTMTFMGSFSAYIIWHELAHQWFGNMVTCGSWHDIWLNEGFATYLNGLCHEKVSNGYWWYAWRSGTLAEVVSLPDGSVYVEDTTSVSRIFDQRLSYQKGAYILHQLRWILGDANFYQSLRNYLNDPALKYRYARTNDLIQHLEQTCDTTLTEYFDTWLYGQGYPTYQIECTKESKGSISIKVNQSQSHPSVTFFKMLLPLKFKNNSGKDTMVVINNSYNGQVFNVNLNFEADSVFFDPDLWLISKNNTITLSVKETPSNNVYMDVFPNPAKDYIYVNYNIAHTSRTKSLAIVDQKGKKMQTISITNPKNNILIDTKSLPSGIYYLCLLVDETTMYTKKITIIR